MSNLPSKDKLILFAVFMIILVSPAFAMPDLSKIFSSVTGQATSPITGMATYAEDSYFLGNVGIGTTSPGAKLEVSGGGYSDSILVNTNNAIGGGISLKSTATGGRRYSILSTGPNAGTGAGYLGFFDDTANAYDMVINSDGKVGIGTIAPSAGLQINTSNPTMRTNGTAIFDGDVGIGTTNPFAKLDVRTAGRGGLGIFVSDHGGIGVAHALNTVGAGDGIYQIGTADGLAKVQLHSNGKSYFNGGNVGIGTADPTQLLDVAGTVKVQGLCIGNDCRTAWPTGGGGGSQWTSSGSNIFYNDGNVGIGMANPNSKLEVVGDVTLSSSLVDSSNYLYLNGYGEGMLSSNRNSATSSATWSAGTFSQSSNSAGQYSYLGVFPDSLQILSESRDYGYNSLYMSPYISSIASYDNSGNEGWLSTSPYGSFIGSSFPYGTALTLGGTMNHHAFVVGDYFGSVGQRNLNK